MYQNSPTTFATDYKVGLSVVLDAPSPFPSVMCYDVKARLSVLACLPFPIRHGAQMHLVLGANEKGQGHGVEWFSSPVTKYRSALPPCPPSPPPLIPRHQLRLIEF